MQLRWAHEGFSSGVQTLELSMTFLGGSSLPGGNLYWGNALRSPSLTALEGSESELLTM